MPNTSHEHVRKGSGLFRLLVASSLLTLILGAVLFFMLLTKVGGK